MATVDTLQIRIETNAEQSANELEHLTKALSKLKSQVSGKKYEQITKGLKGIGEALNTISDSNVRKVTKLANALEKLGNVKSQVGFTKREANSITNISASKLPDINKTIEVETPTKTLNVFNTLSKAFDTLKKKASASFEGIKTQFSKLTRAIMRVAFYRAIRTLIQSITTSIKDGISYIKQYSAAIGGLDTFNANNTLSQYNALMIEFKAILGAVILPLLYKLLPTITNITNAIIKLCDGLAMMTTLMADSTSLTYTTLNEEYFAELVASLEKANTEAGKLKKQLMGFDELNNLTTSQTGSADFDFSKLYKEETITKEMAESTKELKNGLTEALGIAVTLWAFIKGISMGSTIAKWFENVGIIGTTAGSSLGAGLLAGAVAALVGGAVAFGVGIYDAIKNGLDLVSGSLIALGTTMMGAGIGAIIGATIGSVGGPVGALIGAVIGLVIGLITDLTIWCVQNWDKVKAWFKGVGDWFAGIGSWLYDHCIAPIMKVYSNILEWLKQKITPIIEFYKKSFNATWEVIKKLGEIIAKIGEIIAAVFGYAYNQYIKPFVDKIANVLIPIIEKIKTTTINIINGVKSALSGVVNWLSINVFGNLQTFFNKVKTLFSNIGTTIATTFKNALNTVMNGVFSTIENLINGFINGLNNVIGIINKIPGVNISTVAKLELPRFAKGGFPESGQLFLARESGAEMVGSINGRTAVANNEQITSAIASACYSAMSQALSENGMSVVIEGDAKNMFRVMQKEARAYTRNTGELAF